MATLIGLAQLSARPSSQAVAGAKAALPLLPVAVALGTTFGVATIEAGMHPLAAVVMSGLAYAGAAQFAAVGVLAAGGGPLVALLAGVMANARYIPMGLAVARHARGGLAQRFAEAQLMVDESWAIAFAGREFSWQRMLGAGTLFWLGWVPGTALGAFGGAMLGDLRVLGLDGGLAALFLVLAVNQIRSRLALVAAGLGVTITLITLPVLPVGVPIALATAACLLGLRR